MSKTFTFQEAVNEAIAQEAARKDVKDIADSHGEKPVLSEVKVTQETENQVSLPETRSGASAVVSRITHRITADTKAQSVSSFTKQVICSPNVLTGSPL